MLVPSAPFPGCLLPPAPSQLMPIIIISITSIISIIRIIISSIISISSIVIIVSISIISIINISIISISIIIISSSSSIVISIIIRADAHAVHSFCCLPSAPACGCLPRPLMLLMRARFAARALPSGRMMHAPFAAYCRPLSN